MGQTLEALHRLQVLELQLAEIRREAKAKALRVEHHQRLVRRTETKLREQQAAIQERQVRLDAIQLDVSVREEAIDKHRQALNKARTNKEYAAILAAMNTEKADVSKLESQIIELMDEVQAVKDEAAKSEAERAKLAQNVARAEEFVLNYDLESRSQRNGLQDQKNQCAETLEKVILATFDRVAQHHDGEAMVPVVKVHPKRDEYVCSGCNLTLTLEVINVLRSRDEIQLCPACGRILFVESTVGILNRG